MDNNNAKKPKFKTEQQPHEPVSLQTLPASHMDRLWLGGSSILYTVTFNPRHNERRQLQDFEIPVKNLILDHQTKKQTTVASVMRICLD
jgi:hypothetical protein